MAFRHKLGNYVLNPPKMYPRFSSGKYRNQYVHRVIAMLGAGEPLSKDMDVHHRDGNIRNFRPRNLVIMSKKDHGWVSAKQHWYMKQQENKERAAWIEFYRDHTDHVNAPPTETTMENECR